MLSSQFSEEIEFLWRLVRAYGDMYDLSTNTQEKKHYANVGKYFVRTGGSQVPGFAVKHQWV